MPRKSNKLGIYADVREVADLALAHNGGSYELPDKGTAVNFSHRFYNFRKLYREIYHSDGSSCVYDKLIIPRVNSPTVTFKIRQQAGVFKPAQSAPVDLAIAPDEDLFNIAQKIAVNLKGEPND